MRSWEREHLRMWERTMEGEIFFYFQISSVKKSYFDCDIFNFFFSQSLTMSMTVNKYLLTVPIYHTLSSLSHWLPLLLMYFLSSLSIPPSYPFVPTPSFLNLLPSFFLFNYALFLLFFSCLLLLLSIFFMYLLGSIIVLFLPTVCLFLIFFT